MAVLVIGGHHANWGEAAFERLDAVRKYARKTFRNYMDKEVWIDKAVDRYLDTVKRKWEAGKDLRLSLRLLMMHTKRDARKRGRIRHPNLARMVREIREREDTGIDVRNALAKMDDLANVILEMLSHGFKWSEIEQETGRSVWTISKVREELRLKLLDYQPHTPPRKRGRGRPPRNR